MRRAERGEGAADAGGISFAQGFGGGGDELEGGQTGMRPSAIIVQAVSSQETR